MFDKLDSLQLKPASVKLFLVDCLIYLVMKTVITTYIFRLLEAQSSNAVNQMLNLNWFSMKETISSKEDRLRWLTLRNIIVRL